jgi:hypothetical protein
MFDIVSLIIAFGGGILGAALGAVPSFAFVGLLVLVSVAIQAGGGPGDFLGNVAFGAWGPHVGGFATGVAAAGYAASQGKHDSGKDVVSALFGKGWDVLLVGGIFGLVGYVINWALSQVGLPWTDTIALTVVLSGVITRLVWGKSGLLGKVADGTTRYKTFQNNVGMNIVLGLGVGLLSSFMARVLGAEGAGTVAMFGFSALSLVFAIAGLGIPATHHISLPAAVAFMASGSLVWGAIFGIMGALMGDFWYCTLNEHGDTHIDQPAATIATLTSLSLILGAIGVYSALPF